jgi:hypothetical protein
VDTERLAKSRDVSLRSHGICLPCLGEVVWSRSHGDARERLHAYVFFAANLWDEGLGESVRRALVVAVDDGVPDAGAALDDLRDRGLRSEIFRAVVHRLADLLAEETRRALSAALN